MGQAKKRGTFEERKNAAIKEGREKTVKKFARALSYLAGLLIMVLCVTVTGLAISRFLPES